MAGHDGIDRVEVAQIGERNIHFHGIIQRTASRLSNGGQLVKTCSACAAISPSTNAIEIGSRGICPDIQTVFPALMPCE